jgi:hypothetical protein
MVSRAIVIGIGKYRFCPELALQSAVSDAQKMNDFLGEEAGFEDIISLTDPSYADLLNLLESGLIAGSTQNVDRLWFYFSGHGASHDGQDYLIGSDCLKNHTARFGISISQIVTLLRQNQSADVVLILDICHQTQGIKLFDDSIVERTLAAAEQHGITVFFSNYGQSSLRDTFTNALIEGLKQHTLPIGLEAYLTGRIQVSKTQIDSDLNRFRPLLFGKATKGDIRVLFEQANQAESDGRLEDAEWLWQQRLEGLPATELVREAVSAIARIRQKTKQRNEEELRQKETALNERQEELDNRQAGLEKEIHQRIEEELRQKETVLIQHQQEMILLLYGFVA